MAETTKQRTERIMGMSRAQLVMHCQELERQRDLAVEALKEMLEYAGIIEERCDSIATDKARAAIKESEVKE